MCTSLFLVCAPFHVFGYIWILVNVISNIVYGYVWIWLMLYKILYCKLDLTLYCTMYLHNESVNEGKKVKITPNNLVGPHNRVPLKKWVL